MQIFSFFKKEEKKVSGSDLLINPPLNASPEVKFAPFLRDNYSSIINPKKYLKFQRFLPDSIKLVGPPVKGANCFSYVLGLDNSVTSHEFHDIAIARGLEWKTGEIENGDIIVYLGHDNGVCPEFLHAGVYLGDDRVRSRWGIGGPVVEHPIGELLPPFYREIYGSYWGTFRKVT